MSRPSANQETRTEPATPSWITEPLIVETKAVWSPKYGRLLTTREAIEILLTFGRLLDALQEENS